MRLFRFDLIDGRSEMLDSCGVMLAGVCSDMSVSDGKYTCFLGDI